VRARLCSGLGWLGVRLDAAANEDAVGVAARITSASSAIAVDVIPVDEERLIAERVRDALPIVEPVAEPGARGAR
jgi:acetate kinase